MDEEQRIPFTPQFGQRPAIRQGEADPQPPPFAPRFRAPQGVRAQLADRGQTPSIVFNQWRGMFSNANPHVIGNQYLSEQVNLTSAITGQLQVRSGMRQVQFDVDV